MNTYVSATIFSCSDHQGGYAYGNQRCLRGGCLARFAETLLSLLHDNQDQAINLINCLKAKKFSRMRFGKLD